MQIAQVGQTVKKKSNNPFKSGLKEGKVTALCTSLYSPKKKLAYVMDDGSIVHVDTCVVM